MTEERGSLRPLLDAVGGLLSNPAVLEGLAAGISAVSASRRTKNAASDGGGRDAGNILDILPGVLPLLSVLASPPASENRVDEEPPATEEASDADPDENTDGGLDALLPSAEPSVEAAAAVADAEISGASREAQRENLLLALRPFLSESRRSAADAMVQVNKLSGIFRKS